MDKEDSGGESKDASLYAWEVFCGAIAAVQGLRSSCCVILWDVIHGWESSAPLEKRCQVV